MVTELLNQITKTLEEAKIEDFSFEAGIICEEVFGRSFKTDLMLGKLNRKVTQQEREKAEEMVKRRVTGEPIQYVLGEWEFYGLNFKVGKGVLIPRQDTEILVETALKLLKGNEAPKMLDLCSGSGCIPITLQSKLPKAKAFAVEYYQEAFEYLEKNISLHNSGVKAVLADALSDKTAEKFTELDIITCNPPYLTESDMNSLQKEVEFEPATALYGDFDGLKYYRIISSIYKTCLKAGGYLVFEIGATQGEDVAKILSDAGYKNAEVINDYAGRQRVVLAQV